jgi:hypothetical protein
MMQALDGLEEKYTKILQQDVGDLVWNCWQRFNNRGLGSLDKETE